MDVRSREQVSPVGEHNGTVPVWWLINSQELRSATEGGYLELVSEWEVAGGGCVDPHHHPTYEFYYITGGRGLMEIDGETREVRQGDLITVPPDAVHSLRTLSDSAPVHGIIFAVGLPGTTSVNYTSH